MPATPAAPVPLAELRRGGRPECVHLGSLVVCDTQGRLLLAQGAPDQPTFLRSSAKLFQALTVVRTGAADRWGLTPAELAVVCALPRRPTSSPGSGPKHLRQVRPDPGRPGLWAP